MPYSECTDLSVDNFSAITWSFKWGGYLHTSLGSSNYLLGPYILFQQWSPITVEGLMEKLCLKRLQCICLANLSRVFGEKHSTFPSICWYQNTSISTVSKHLRLGKDPKNKKVKVNQTCSSTQSHIKKKKKLQKSLSKYDRWPKPTKQVTACHQL